MNHLFASVAATLCLLALSIAASAADPTSNNMATVTVTASRTPTPIDDAGSAISIINHKQILEDNAITLGNLLRGVPGIAVSRQGGIGTFTQVRMRGAEANQVLVLINGVAANDVAQGSGFNFADVLPSDIRRVEVVRGPQSALWGSDALAGVINIITEPGRNGARGSSFTAQAGSNSTQRSSLDYDNNWQKGGLSIALSHFHTAGTRISQTGNKRNGYSNLTLDMSGRLQVTDDARLTAMTRATNATTHFDAIDPKTGLPIDAPYFTDSLQRYDEVALHLRLGDNVQQIVTLERTYTHNVNHTNAKVNDTSDGANNSLHLQTNVELGNNILSLVAEHELLLFRQRGAISAYGNPDKDLSSRTYSLAAELHHEGRLVDWSMSGRHDNNSDFANAYTWRVTGLVHVTSAVGVYASAGKGIKNPTFTERFGYFNTFLGNPNLLPEQSIGWELGLRGSPSQVGLELSANYFQSRLKNEINGYVFDPAVGRYTAENSSKTSHRRGVELELDWDATARASIHGSYTWLDATQPGPNGPQEEVRRPKNSASLQVNYALGRANVNLAADYTGPQIDDFYPPYPPYLERVKLGGFMLVNVSARYTVNDSVTLTANVDNLTNKHYQEVYGYREPGIAAYAGVNVKL